MKALLLLTCCIALAVAICVKTMGIWASLGTIAAILAPAACLIIATYIWLQRHQ